MRPVLRKSMCRSSTKIRKMRPDASLVGRGGGRMHALHGGGGGGADVVETSAAVRQHERHDVLLDAVLVDSKSFFERSATNWPPRRGR